MKMRHAKESAVPFSIRRAARVLIGVGIIFGFVQVFETNTIVGLGYSLNEQKAKITNLNDENQILRIKISGVAAFANLADDLKALRLVPANDVHYIAVSAEKLPVVAQAPGLVF